MDRAFASMAAPNHGVSILDSRAPQRHTDAVRKRVHIALAVLLVVLVSVTAWEVLRPSEPEPVYQGKALRVWLSDNFIAWGRQDGRAQDVAQEAIRQIGTNAIPVLLKMMRRKDSPLISNLISIWNRHIMGSAYLRGWVRLPAWYLTQAAILNFQASKGFEALRADAQPAVPELIRIYDRSSSPDSQSCASMALIAIGPEAARAAIPSFLRAAASSDARRRETAVFALAKVHIEPQLVVPGLMKALSDTDANVRGMAVVGLNEIGWSGGARPAVPALVQLLGDPDGKVRRAAAEALRNIDYDAAARAGVK